MSYSSEVLADSPLGYWRLGEPSGSTATDSSGNARHGTYVGPTLGAASLLPAHSDAGADFDGLDYVEVAHDAALDSFTFSVEAWVHLDSMPAVVGMLAIRRGAPGSTSLNQQSWDWRITPAGRVELLTISTGSPVTIGTSTNPITTGQTYHLVVTKTGSTVVFYVNGVAQVSTGTAWASPNSTNSRLLFGADRYSPGAVPATNYGIDGRMDEVAFYTGALSASRVAAHYAAAYEAAAQRTSTSGSATVSSTWAPLSTSGALDVRVTAAVGDKIEVGASWTWQGWTGSANFVYGDFGVMVGGSPVRWVSTGTASHVGGIYGLFQASHAGNVPSSGSGFYTVQSGDLVGGVITFRAYGKTSAGTRALLNGVPQAVWAAPCPTGYVTGTIPAATLTTAWAQLGSTVTVAAAAGDVLAITSNALITPSGAVDSFDAATIVGGSRVNYASTQSSTVAGGVSAWRTVAADYEPAGGGTILYTVQAGDVVGGNVTVGLVGVTATGSIALDTGSSFTVRKV